MAEAPKVSVCTVTYNHEQFLAEALDSMLMQERDFELEILVGEDCSTDRTREILVDYARRHPDIVRPILRDANVGALTNFTDVWMQCRGEYIAVLDGDDFWLDPRKLQKQVDFLDARPDYSVVGHRIRTDSTDAAGQPASRISPSEASPIPLEALVQRQGVATQAMLARRSALTEFPSWYFETRLSDRCLELVLGMVGKVGFIDEVMSVYRFHGGGVWSEASKEENINSRLHLGELFLANLDPSLHAATRRRMAVEHVELTWIQGQRGEMDRAREHWSQAKALDPSGWWLRPEYLRWQLWLTLPGLYGKLRAVKRGLLGR